MLARRMNVQIDLTAIRSHAQRTTETAHIRMLDFHVEPELSHQQAANAAQHRRLFRQPQIVLVDDVPSLPAIVVIAGT